MRRLLLVDGMNFLWRARAGFSLGDHAVTYNFFRNLRALIEKIDPSHVILVLEGTPRDRNNLFPAYKANRVVQVDHTDQKSLQKAEAEKSFFRQCDECVELIQRALPVQVCRHPNYEADDVIYTLIKRFTVAGDVNEFIVASNDTDFIQLLNEFQNVKVWNPMEKSWVEAPQHDYVTWKALKGDATDNIPGLPGVGVVTADKMMALPEMREKILAEGNNREIFELNKKLIKLCEIPSKELGGMDTTHPTRDWVEVVSAFKGWGFKSIFKDTKTGNTWDKFKSTFDKLR